MAMKAVGNQRKSQRLSIRIAEEQKSILSRAARKKGVTDSEFLITSAMEAANDVLAEQTEFSLPKEQWVEFCRKLDAPPKHLDELRKVAQERSPFREQ
ncbi:MAG: DUF1778 domain-containing protein [Fimbriimonadaceae bacterium]